jgi:hypothetical protein
MPIGTFLDGVIPTRLRGLAFLALSDTGHLETQVSTDDSGGGASQVWTAGTAIPCRVDDMTGSEQLSAGRISDRSTHTIMVAPDVVPTPADRFLIDGKGTFEITAVRNRTREWLQILEAAQVMNPV